MHQMHAPYAQHHGCLGSHGRHACRVHLFLSQVLEEQGEPRAALRHAAIAAKCLPGDPGACMQAAALWRQRSKPAREQGAAGGAPKGAHGAGSTVEIRAQVDALEDEVARAMLHIEEAQGRFKSKAAPKIDR